MIVVEACVTSLPEARDAVRGGAARLELCADLATGGLSPDPAMTVALVEELDVPVVVMVRPRAGTFRMTPREVSAMAGEIESLARVGVGGVVLGVLDSGGFVDGTGLAELVSAAGSVPVTFHRAFDEVSDSLRALETLADAGVARILTSGGGATAWEGRLRLRDLVEAAAGRLSIVGGGRVRGDHVKGLVAATGLTEVHARASAIPAIVRALTS